VDSWHGYPSIFALGHRALADLFTVPVIVEEKIDGSQFSFGVDENGDLHCRSKGAIIYPDAPEKLFARAVDTAKALRNELRLGWTYRCEYLSKPKHNTLSYNRIPLCHLILFDVNTGHEQYLDAAAKAIEAKRLGLDCVPVLHSGLIRDNSILTSLLSTESILGGVKIEGVVVKQQEPTLFGPDKKALIGKFVSEAFKEIHGKEWKKMNPSNSDIIDQIGAALKTDARWKKAVQHLRDRGALEDSPRDIPALLKEVSTDVLKECETEIKERLFKYAWPKISRQVIAGLPEWWKQELLLRQFGEAEAQNTEDAA